VFFYSGGEVFWNTIKEAVNLLSSTNTSTSSDERKGNSNVRGAVEGNGYHQIRDPWNSEFKIMIPGYEGIIEHRSIHRDMCKGVL
jgi:hypothetical protein